jgi:Fe-S-cluster-containing dehydrogenase component/formate-dependent nitrite reductase membrane component NrfD
MNYGFVIDNRSCIGCHACSTACKSENSVPLGVSRTWVKYVEAGQYPDTRRTFQVTRCNHCANPPCVRICPTQAMYQRADGIVEFDNSICIGCKACMQACPYDAIYIDPDTHTAAKCHYCGHRVEVGLEPACVVVCPTHSIISGDMDDPVSEISHVLAANQVTVRKPEQGTAPKLFYINGTDVALHPTAVERTPETFMWADVIPLHSNGGHGKNHAASVQSTSHSKSGAALRAPGPQGDPSGGPIQFGGKMAEHMVQVGYNAQHKIPWHWPVPAYLVTKCIGAGLFLILSLGLIFNLITFDPLLFLVGGFVSLLFIGLTTLLLVIDLDQPARFFYILLRPQWNSWLARGAFLMVGFTAAAGLWWLIEAGAYFHLLPADVAAAVRLPAMGIGALLALGVAVYTAFLFGQAEGRDLWQSSLLPVHLLVQSAMAGSGVLMVILAAQKAAPALLAGTGLMFALSLVIDLIVTFFGEFGMPHASEVAARAAHDITRGNYRNHFWLGSLTLGHVIPLALVFFAGGSLAGVAAAVCSLIGLYFFEYAFVMAPQEIPNS